MYKGPVVREGTSGEQREGLDGWGPGSEVASGIAKVGRGQPTETLQNGEMDWGLYPTDHQGALSQGKACCQSLPPLCPYMPVYTGQFQMLTPVFRYLRTFSDQWNTPCLSVEQVRDARATTPLPPPTPEQPSA